MFTDILDQTHFHMELKSDGNNKPRSEGFKMKASWTLIAQLSMASSVLFPFFEKIFSAHIPE
jgi:hypothetical protein